MAQADGRCYAVDIKHPETSVRALQQQENRLRVSMVLYQNRLTNLEERLTLTVVCLQELQVELRGREALHASLQALWSQLQPDESAEESNEAQEKLHVTGNKLRQLKKKVDEDLCALQQRLLTQDLGFAEADTSQDAAYSKTTSSTERCIQRMWVFSTVNQSGVRSSFTNFGFVLQTKKGILTPTIVLLPPLTGRLPPPAPAAATSAPPLPDSFVGERPRLHCDQQLCQVLLPHVALYQWSPPHLMLVFIERHFPRIQERPFRKSVYLFKYILLGTKIILM